MKYGDINYDVDFNDRRLSPYSNGNNNVLLNLKNYNRNQNKIYINFKNNSLNF